MFKSTNSGVSFSKTAAAPDLDDFKQAGYDLAIAVSPTNAEVVFTGGINVWKTTNGGATFTQVSYWSQPSSQTYTHTDIHYLNFYNNKLYYGSDGGIYVSEDNGASFADLSSGLQIGQFYRITVSEQISDRVAGGLQGNGGYTYKDNSWKNYFVADGMEVVIDPNNYEKVYGFIQNGKRLCVSDDGGNSLRTQVDSPSYQNGLWITPLAINFKGEVYSGFDAIYKLNGFTWKKIIETNLEGAPTNLYIDPSNDDII